MHLIFFLLMNWHFAFWGGSLFQARVNPEGPSKGLLWAFSKER